MVKKVGDITEKSMLYKLIDIISKQYSSPILVDLEQYEKNEREWIKLEKLFMDNKREEEIMKAANQIVEDGKKKVRESIQEFHCILGDCNKPYKLAINLDRWYSEHRPDESNFCEECLNKIPRKDADTGMYRRIHETYT